jgi:hypothetical protein
MRTRIAVVIAALALSVVPLSAASAAETCVRLSLPNQTVCSSNGFVYQAIGEKFTRVYKVERQFVRPEDSRSPRFVRLSGSEFRLVFVGLILQSQTETK